MKKQSFDAMLLKKYKEICVIVLKLDNNWSDRESMILRSILCEDKTFADFKFPKMDEEKFHKTFKKLLAICDGIPEKISNLMNKNESLKKENEMLEKENQELPSKLFEVPAFFFGLELSGLGFSKSLVDKLIAVEIDNVGKLLSLSAEDLSHRRNLAGTSIKKIEAVLKEKGLKLKDISTFNPKNN